MTSALQHPSLLLVLLITGVLVACLLIVLAIFLIVRPARKKKDEPEEEKNASDMPLFVETAASLRESFREAMRRLREKTPGWNYRYAAPWYVLVGEPGSGKSTIADELSGLNSESIDAPAGETAPRWLLLDQAVLVDLPGSDFAGQDAANEPASTLGLLNRAKPSGAAHAWRSFLQLTAKYRPRQPLNGIVLTVSATELLAAVSDPDHQKRMLRLETIGKRLNEVQAITGLALPIYVVVTRCDSVEGFTTYANTILKQGVSHPQKWSDGFAGENTDLFGWSNPYSLVAGYSSAWVDEAFDSIEEVLLHRQLEILAACQTVEQANGVFLFPFGFQQMREPLRVLLDLIFGSTAYQTPHLLRGVYLSGRDSDVVAAQRVGEIIPAMLTIRSSSSALLFVKDLFDCKVFAEPFLAVPVARRLFRGNRSVLAARIAACVLPIVFLLGFFHAWMRIAHLQSNVLNPVLFSLTDSLNDIAGSAQADVRPAVSLINNLGMAHQSEYVSVAMPYSYLDVDGLRHNLQQTLEHTFEVVILRSCQEALQARITSVMAASNTIPAPAASDQLPPGNAWSADPAYLALEQYLTQLRELNTNIDRYGLISGAGQGSFEQLNQLLHYLGARGLPDSSRLAQDPRYQKLLLNAAWKPLEVPAGYDKATSNITAQLIDSFYDHWLNENPLHRELAALTGPQGLLKAIGSVNSVATNDQLRSFVSKTDAIENQLNSGGYDWIAGSFRRENYPALGAELDQMSFATDEFTNRIEIDGAARLAGLREELQKDGGLEIANNTVRLDGQISTLSAVLSSLLSYDLMADEGTGTTSCRVIPRDYIWNQADLAKAMKVEATRTRIESQLLPSLSDKYRSEVQAIVDNRAATTLFALVENAAIPAPAQDGYEAALEASLQNFSQSADQLRQVSQTLASLHATSATACMNRSMVDQAESLLDRVNRQARELYLHATTSDDGSNGMPNSQWLFGLSSPDDVQNYLVAEKQKVVALTADAAPLVKVLRPLGGHSSVLTKWYKISQDVSALEAKMPDNPIQALESFVSTQVDSITPQNGCKAPSFRASADEFLDVRADLARLAVDRCHRTAIARFNAIANSFNTRLGGRFPFSANMDTRAGAEAMPSDIAEFYQAADLKNGGLIATLVNAASDPQEATSFLHSVLLAHPLVTGTAEAPNPAFAVKVQFRTNRAHEVMGDRIASWTLSIGGQTVDSHLMRADSLPLTWQFGDPVVLTVRYANNSPEVPAPGNPSPAAHVKDRTVMYSYSDLWSLFALLRDHASGPGQPPDQYMLRIPNQYTSSGNQAAPPDTIVYLQIDLQPPGAKPGSPTLPIPAFPSEAPTVALKPAQGK